MCTDPDEYGHRNVNQAGRDKAGGPADQVRTQIDAEEAARIKRRQVIAGNKQWRAATAQRQEFLRGLAARKTPPARALTRVLAAVGGCDWDLINALQQGNSLAGELLGFKAGTGRDKIPEMITQASDKRAAVIALIILLASREIPTADEHVWRKDEWQWSTHRKTAAPYLAFLRDELGYTLSPIEAAVAAGEHRPARRRRGRARPGKTSRRRTPGRRSPPGRGRGRRGRRPGRRRSRLTAPHDTPARPSPRAGAFAQLDLFGGTA